MNHKSLPGGYRYLTVLDFMRNRGQIMAILKLSLALLIGPLIAGLVACPPKPSWRGFLQMWPQWAAMLGMLAAYIPLHELTHGAAMFALSGVKPDFGLRLPYAWCGSTAWFDRKSHVLTALAPVIVWGVLLQILIAVSPGAWFWPLWAVQISNLSGSAGDLYCAWVLLRMDGDVLIQDIGTRMRIYIKREVN